MTKQELIVFEDECDSLIWKMKEAYERLDFVKFFECYTTLNGMIEVTND